MLMGGTGSDGGGVCAVAGERMGVVGVGMLVADGGDKGEAPWLLSSPRHLGSTRHCHSQKPQQHVTFGKSGIDTQHGALCISYTGTGGLVCLCVYSQQVQL